MNNPDNPVSFASVKPQPPRYEYLPLFNCNTNESVFMVLDKEATGLWNSWQFDTEQEALDFIKRKVVVPFPGRVS